MVEATPHWGLLIRGSWIIARPPPWALAILSRTPELGWNPLSCCMIGCWQINSILANIMNIGHKNSIRILNRYTSYEIYWYKFVLQSYHLRKVALISYSLSKAASKAAENNGLIGLISQPPAGSTLAGVWYGQTDDGYHRKQHLLRVVWLTGCSAYAMHLQPKRDTLGIAHKPVPPNGCIFPLALDIIPTSLAVAYSIGKYTNQKLMSHHVTYSPIPRQFSAGRQCWRSAGVSMKLRSMNTS